MEDRSAGRRNSTDPISYLAGEVSMKIGAAHVVAALAAYELAFHFGETSIAHRTIEHRFIRRGAFPGFIYFSQVIHWPTAIMRQYV